VPPVITIIIHNLQRTWQPMFRTRLTPNRFCGNLLTMALAILKRNKVCTPSDTTFFLCHYFKCWRLVPAWQGHHQTKYL